MTATTDAGDLIKVDCLGRVRASVAQRDALLDAFAASGLSGLNLLLNTVLNTRPSPLGYRNEDAVRASMRNLKFYWRFEARQCMRDYNTISTELDCIQHFKRKINRPLGIMNELLPLLKNENLQFASQSVLVFLVFRAVLSVLFQICAPLVWARAMQKFVSKSDRAILLSLIR